METRAKYGNVKVEIDGLVFDSRAEGRRYRELRLLEDAEEIKNLKLQPVFELAPAVVLDGRLKPSLRYRADFQYVDCHTGETTIEDVKSEITRRDPLYRCKRHLMKSVLGLDVTEVS